MYLVYLWRSDQVLRRGEVAAIETPVSDQTPPRKVATAITLRVHPDGTRTPVVHEAPELELQGRVRQVHKIQTRRG